MKSFIIACLVGFLFLSVGCNKAKIRTCTINSYDGNTYTVLSPQPLTRAEMNAYESELELSNTPANTPGAKTTVHCK